MATQQFIVTRYGSNKANQSMTPEMIVGTVEAENEVEAEKAARAEFTCYANQHFGVQLASEATAEDCNTAFEADQQHAADTEAFTV